MHHIAQSTFVQQIDSNAITTEERERRGAVLWGVSVGEARHSAGGVGMGDAAFRCG